MRNFYYFIFFCFSFSFVLAQVGIGTVAPNPSAILDISASDKGVLLPRVALTSSSDTATITNGNQQGLLVYNTATVSDVSPGFYYWDGVEWKRFSTATPSSSADYYEVVYSATNGQAQFSTPVAFSNPNKINVFRNGVRVGFTQVDPTTLELEADAICYQNDEIRIVQIN